MNDILLKKKNRKNAHTRKRNGNQDKGMVVGKKPLRARVSEARRANGWLRHDLQKIQLLKFCGDKIFVYLCGTRNNL